MEAPWVPHWNLGADAWSGPLAYGCLGPREGQKVGWGNYSMDRWKQIRGAQNPLLNSNLGGLSAEGPCHIQEALGGSKICKFCGFHS